jgi:hypothetical protein
MPAVFSRAALVAAAGLRLYRRARIKKARFAPIEAAATFSMNGAIAQLGERFNGIEEVVGSIPSGSTTDINSLGKRLGRKQYAFGIKSPPRRHGSKKSTPDGVTYRRSRGGMVDSLRVRCTA